jgi:hypothetical protein
MKSGLSSSMAHHLRAIVEMTALVRDRFLLLLEWAFGPFHATADYVRTTARNLFARRMDQRSFYPEPTGFRG